MSQEIKIFIGLPEAGYFLKNRPITLRRMVNTIEIKIDVVSGK
jgi:hypothetical protein